MLGHGPKNPKHESFMPALLVRTGLWQGKCPVKTQVTCVVGIFCQRLIFSFALCLLCYVNALGKYCTSIALH